MKQPEYIEGPKALESRESESGTTESAFSGRHEFRNSLKTANVGQGFDHVLSKAASIVATSLIASGLF